MKKKHNRRKFLKKATAITAIVAASTLLSKTLSAEKKYNWKMVTTWPKNFPGLGTCAEIFAKMVNEGSATYGKIDKLSGLKENVIVGRLIPAGTGNMTTEYSKVAAKKDKEILEQREKITEIS